MFKWKDRKYKNPRKKVFKDLDTGKILNLEVQDDPDNILEESDTPLTDYCLNMAQNELVDDMSKTYKGTNITAPTVAGAGRTNKVYGFSRKENGASSSSNYPSAIHCLGDDINLFDIDSAEKNKLLAWATGLSSPEQKSLVSDFIRVYPNQKIVQNYASSVFFYDANKNHIGNLSTGGLLNSEGTAGAATKKYTIPNENSIAYMRLSLRSISNSNIDMTTVEDIKVQEGEVVTLWSPYNHGNVINKSSNKNLFNKETVANGYWLNESGNLVGSTGYCVSDFIEIKEGKEYFLPKRGTTRTKFFDKNKVALTNTWDIADYSAPFVAPTNAKYIRFSINTSIVDINTFQFEEGHIATEYVEHEGDEQVTYLKEPLRGINGVYDELDLSKGEIIRRFTEIVLDGSDDEDWHLWSANLTNTERFFMNLEKPTINASSSLCSHFYYKNDNSDVEHFRWSTVSGIIKQLVIYINKNNVSTLAELKTWLSENPITIIYELAEPIIEHIDCSDKIKQFDGQTTIFNTDEAELECTLTNNTAIAQINQNLQKIEDMISSLKAGE